MKSRTTPPDRCTSAYGLRLLASIKAEAERLALADGTSLNQFVAVAVAEKLGFLRAAEFFAERRARADWVAFDRFMARDGGEAPRPGDELRTVPTAGRG